MIFLIFTSVLAAAAAGLLVKYVLDRLPEYPQEVTWREFSIGMMIIACIVSPGVTKVGWELVRSNNVTFGSCYYEYDCDPYIVMVSYSCGTEKNPQTCQRPETRYHECPYVSNEFNYIVKTTLRNHTIDTHRFPENPQEHRWRRNKSIPNSVIQKAGVGQPSFWTDAYERIRSGRPGPVTIRKEYENYILASDQTIFRQYSGEIDRFLKTGVLPTVQSGVHDFYLADKVYFVGYHPTDSQVWQNAVAYLNAGLGPDLQGDLHLVLVQNQSVSANPDVYALALRAYWLNKDVQNRNAFAKNGIGVVVGTTNGKTVAWARAFTGMPIGNEALIVGIRKYLQGIPLTPEMVVGNVQGGFKTPTIVQSIHTKGILESMLWGLTESQTKFQRYSMGGDNNKGGLGAGYLYLWGEIQPKPVQKFWIWFVTFLATGVVWTIFTFVGEKVRKQKATWPNQAYTRRSR